MLRALFSSLVAIGRFLMFLLNAKQIGLVNYPCEQGVRDGLNVICGRATRIVLYALQRCL